MSDRSSATDRVDRTAVEAVQFLTRAESRLAVMRELAERDYTTQRELRDALDASRTTVARALNSLQDRGWIEQATEGYCLTTTGTLIASSVTQLLDTVATTAELSAFLRYAPTDAINTDLLTTADVTVTTPTDADPYAPARKQTEIVHRADRLRVLLPATDLESTRAVTDAVTEDGLELESVVSPSVAATFETPEFKSLVKEGMSTGRSTVLVSPTELPYYLGLADEEAVQIGVADDEGIPRALLETTDARVRQWAEGVYSEYRDAAEARQTDDF